MRRIKRAQIQRLALCKRGKNGMTTLFKSDGTAEFANLVKADMEKGELLVVVYPKGLADADGDIADTEAAIKSMTSSLIKSQGALDIEHDGKVLPDEAAYLSEIFTIQKSDERFHGWKNYDGEVVDVTGGAAAVIQIDDPALRAAYRDGDWDGVSVFGPAVVEQVDVKAASQRVAARMGAKETDMTKEELQAALSAFKTEMVDLVKSALTAEKPQTQAQDTKQEDQPVNKLVAPEFTGDPLDPNALADYEKQMRAYELRKAIQSGTLSADDIAQMRKSMTETQPTVDQLNEAGLNASEEDSAEVRALQVKLFKAQKRTNAPERVETDENAELQKSQQADIKAITDMMNGGSAQSSMRIVSA